MWSGGQHWRQPWQGSTDRVLGAPPNQRPKCIGDMRFFSTGETIVGSSVKVNQQNSTNRPSKQSKHEILHTLLSHAQNLFISSKTILAVPVPRDHPLIHRLHHQHLLPITSHPPKPNHNQRHSQHKHQPNQHLTTPPPNPTRVTQRRTPYTRVNIIGGTTQNPTMPGGPLAFWCEMKNHWQYHHLRGVSCYEVETDKTCAAALSRNLPQCCLYRRPTAVKPACQRILQCAQEVLSYQDTSGRQCQGRFYWWFVQRQI